jgi:hypothetical protein
MSAKAYSWLERQVIAKRQFRRAIGARAARWPEIPIGPLSGHGFASLTKKGLILIEEVWCDNSSVIENMRAKMRHLIKLGFRCAELPTQFSTRDIGRRRPVIIIPPGSDVDPQEIYEQPVAVNFKGVKFEE